MTKLQAFLKLARSLKKSLVLLLLAFLTAFLCLARSPVLAKIPNANAIATYQQVDESEENTRHLLVKAQNFQASGHYRNACRTLLEALEIADLDCQTLISDDLSSQDFTNSFQNLPSSPFKVTGLRMLGDVMRMVGAINTSEKMLDLSLKMAADSEISAVHLSLGNTKRALGKRKDYFDGESAGKTYYEAALEEYKQAIALSPQASLTATSPSDSIRLRAKLSQLNLLIEEPALGDVSYLWREVKDEVDNLPENIEAVYARMDLAQSLTCLKLQGMEKAERNLLRSPEPPIAKPCLSKGKIETPDWQEIARLLKIAERQAKELGDERSQAYALGYLGELYEITQQWSDAKKLTEQALNIAQSKQAWDIAYQWQWQLGRAIVKMGGNREEAIAAYQVAVDSTKYLRKDLASINLDVQFSFRDSVDPIYRQYVDLLLPQPGTQPIIDNLKKAREVIADLQVAELENFLRCTLQVKKPVLLDQVADRNNAAIFYPIILPERLGVIVKLPNSDELLYHEKRIDPAEVNHKLETLRKELEYRRVTPEGKRLSQEVYNWLIRPAENYPDRPLDPSRVKTLVFVLDGRLRNIPMAALLDDQQYLVEKYAVALNLGLELQNPQPFRQIRLEALTAGLTEDVRELNRLQFAGRELDSIKSLVPSTEIRDNTFVTKTFKNLINSQFFSVVHLVTHGQFSSQREKTSIEAYDESIKVAQFQGIFQTQSQTRPDPIELLVLSACQTAAGDDRAVLGLAGVAVQSGARSTIASLWYLNDESSAILMNRFYRYLKDPNVPNKAEALRLAQQEQMKDTNYNYKSPSYWAAFVLVGNWL